MDYADLQTLQAFMSGSRQKAPEKLFDNFKEIIKDGKTCKVCVNLDWLSVMFLDVLDTIKEVVPGSETVFISNTISIRFYGKGTEHYKYIWDVLYNGEFVANILSHTRNEKFVKKGVVKVDFKNFLLYTSSLWPIYNDIVNTFKLKYKNISRVDICVDGLTYLMKFLNVYVKQEYGEKAIEIKGKSKVNFKMFDKKTTMFQAFGLGVVPKSITMYNKSLEIVKSGKEYIQKMWIANGICKDVIPVKELHEAYLKLKPKQQEEKIYLNGFENIYRFETRLTGATILKMVDFKMEWLQDVNQLMSIIKRTNDNFFEFVWYTYGDLSKCEGIEIMPYLKYDIKNIEMEKAKPRDDLYKTKLSIKKNIRQLFIGNLGPGDMAVSQMLVFDIENFELHDWYNQRINGWCKEFALLNLDEDYVSDVNKFLFEITAALGTEKIVDFI